MAILAKSESSIPIEDDALIFSFSPIFYGAQLEPAAKAAGVRSASTPGWALELDVMGVVNQAVKDGIRDSWIADGVMPEFQRELTGQQRGAAILAVVEYFQEVTVLRLMEFLQAPVVDDQKAGFLQLAGQPRKAAVSVGGGQLPE